MRDEEGRHTLGLYPTASPSKADIARWDDDLLGEVKTFELSRGNSWPDTVSMIAEVEERLSRGRPALFRFQGADDATACWDRPLQAGVPPIRTKPA